MGKNKKTKQLEDVKNLNSPKVTMTDSTPGKKQKKKNKAIVNSTEGKMDLTKVDSEVKMDINTNVEEETKQDSLDIKVNGVGGEQKKKKKKNKQKNQNGKMPCNDNNVDQGQKENDTAPVEVSQVDIVAEEPKKSKKKKNKQNLANQQNTNTVVTQETEQDTVQKLESSDKLEQNSTGKGKNKNKKKNMKNQQNVDTKETSKSDISVNGNASKKKNKRKAGKGTTQDNGVNDAEEEPAKKKKKEADDSSEEESAGEAAGKENETVEAVVGQWGTDAFENAERHQKFIKLLGGAKQKDKSFSGIQQKLFSIGMSDVDDFKAGGSTAMNFKQQNKYMQDMETDFEKARGSHFNRGRGFGYRKPFMGGRGGHTEKKSFIDVTKSKSIKFDD